MPPVLSILKTAGVTGTAHSFIKREPFRDMISRDLSLLIFVAGYHIVILGLLALIIGAYFLVKVVT
jgi:hypothetical protein